MQAGNALELAFSLAFAQSGAKRGEGDGHEQGESEGPEGCKPEDPRVALAGRTAVLRQNDGTDERKRQRNHES